MVICPRCRSEDVELHLHEVRFDIEMGELVVEAKCNDCKVEFDSVWSCNRTQIPLRG